MNHQPDKLALRVAALACRSGISAHQRQQYSECISDNLRAYLTSLSAPPASLLVYRAMASEVNTEMLFAWPDYQIFAPVARHQKQMDWYLTSTQTSWKKGVFGVLEPSSGALWADQAGTILLCPLTAFDRRGNRLGMGKGCFDYWLGRHRQALDQVIGLAFSGQEVAHIPAERHDAPMNCVITEKEVIACLKC